VIELEKEIVDQKRDLREKNKKINELEESNN
jgi:hypothetical protein